MSLDLKYTPYNSSWIKFLGYVVIGSFFYNKTTFKDIQVGSIIDMNASFLEKFPAVLGRLICIGYYTHNLYSQYQHNKSLEFEFDAQLKNNSDKITVVAKPSYCDVYTVYNISGLLYHLIGATTITLALDKIMLYSTISNIPMNVAKLAHLFSSEYQNYNFFNKETGEMISQSLTDFENYDIHNSSFQEIWLFKQF